MLGRAAHAVSKRLSQSGLLGKGRAVATAASGRCWSYLAAGTSMHYRCTGSGNGTRGSWSSRLGLGSAELVELSFTGGNDVTVTVKARVGDSILQVARSNDVELEAVCEGQLACATCHTIFESSLYDELPPPNEDELDMLDSAENLCATSRLGCQVRVSKAFAGARLRIISDVSSGVLAEG